MASLTQDVRNFIEETFFVMELQQGNDPDFGNDDMFLANGIIDSNGVLEVVSWMEEKFDIKIHDEELNPGCLGSINNMVATIERKQKEGAQ